MRYLKRNAMKKRKQNSQASAEPSPLTTPSSTTFQLHVVRECSRMDLQHEGGPQLPRPRHAFYRHQSRTSLSKRKQNCQASPEPPFQYAIEFWRSSFARMRRVQNKGTIPTTSPKTCPFTAINQGPLCLLGSVDLQHEGGPQLPRPGKVRGARGAAQLPKSSLAMAVIVGVMVGADDVVMAAWFHGSRSCRQRKDSSSGNLWCNAVDKGGNISLTTPSSTASKIEPGHGGHSRGDGGRRRRRDGGLVPGVDKGGNISLTTHSSTALNYM